MKNIKFYYISHKFKSFGDVIISPEQFQHPQEKVLLSLFLIKGLFSIKLHDIVFSFPPSFSKIDECGLKSLLISFHFSVCKDKLFSGLQESGELHGVAPIY